MAEVLEEEIENAIKTADALLIGHATRKRIIAMIPMTMLAGGDATEIARTVLEDMGAAAPKVEPPPQRFRWITASQELSDR